MKPPHWDTSSPELDSSLIRALQPSGNRRIGINSASAWMSPYRLLARLSAILPIPPPLSANMSEAAEALVDVLHDGYALSTP